VHGKTVCVVTPENFSEKPEGDGMVTADAGIMLAVASADCVPILMMDAAAKIVGAIHAGWRGVIAGIAEAGVRAIESLGAKPRDLRAALGPSIGQCCFEVAKASRIDLHARWKARSITRARDGRANRTSTCVASSRINSCARGIPRESIMNVGPCTKCANDRFFSRRADASSGLQISFIGIRG